MAVRILSGDLINLISAGEVIERPVSALKELIENSLDALATSIDVVIKSGGKNLIQIKDNGIGMNRDDAIMSFERHATSKLADIYRINTFGFRGEALPSISAVSKMVMKTSDQDNGLGTEISIDAGRMKSVDDVAFCRGTSIELAFLFFNQPARRKYLKTDRTEYGHIVKYLNRQALVTNEIHYRFFNEKGMVFDYPGCANLEERVRQIAGDRFVDNAIFIDESGDCLSFKCFYSKPDSKLLDIHNVFVNSRDINSAIITKAIASALGGKPDFVIFIDIDPGMVDVNVHPSKREVRFLDSKAVYSFIHSCVIESLKIYGKKFFKTSDHLEADLKGNDSDGELGDDFILQDDKADSAIWSFAGEQPVVDLGHNVNVADKDVSNAEIKDNIQQSFEFPVTNEEVVLSPEISSASLIIEKNESAGKESSEPTSIHQSNIRPIGQFGGTFLLVEIEDELYVIDQHTAHERVLYEELSCKLGKSVASQMLVFPLSVYVPPERIEFVLDFEEEFKKLGIGIEQFGNDSILIRSLPAMIKISDHQKMIDEIIDWMVEREEGVVAGDDKRTQLLDGIITLMSCHGAIRANQLLDDAEIKSLVSRLMKTSTPFLCPHGRPIIIRFNKFEIEKMFGRK